MTIRPGEEWGSPTDEPPDLDVHGSDAALRRGRRRRTGRADPVRSPTRPVTCARGRARHRARPRRRAGNGAAARRARASATARSRRNLCVIGTPPDRLRWSSPAIDLDVEIDGTAWFSGPATTVVIATGQFLPGPRHRAPRSPRRREGRDPGVRARPAASAARCAPVSPPAPTFRTPESVSAPPDPSSSGPARRHPARSTASPGPRPRALDRPPPAGVPAPDLVPTKILCRAEDHRYSSSSMLYAPERFTEDEAATLRPYFTNLDQPVFALINLPEVVKGALFARVLALRQEPAPALSRRVRRRSRSHRRPHRRRDRRARSAPSSSTSACSSSTATTRLRSSAVCTSRVSRRRTC